MSELRYLAPDWRDVLVANGLADWSALWDLQAPWFEPPNRRRGGWSGVNRIELNVPHAGSAAVFIKRQENHVRRSWRHPWRGELTLAAELRVLRALQRAGVASLEPVFFAQHARSGKRQALLATAELTGYIDLQQYLQRRPPAAERRRVLGAVARLVRRLHDAGFVHNALHAKHVFVRPAGEARLIDLEKTRRTLLRHRAWRRDLDSLNRRTMLLSRTDRLRFLLAYLGEARTSARARVMWRTLTHLARRKRVISG